MSSYDMKACCAQPSEMTLGVSSSNIASLYTYPIEAPLLHQAFTREKCRRHKLHAVRCRRILQASRVREADLPVANSPIE
jgi:hypothetical protein